MVIVAVDRVVEAGSTHSTKLPGCSNCQTVAGQRWPGFSANKDGSVFNNALSADASLGQSRSGTLRAVVVVGAVVVAGVVVGAVVGGRVAGGAVVGGAAVAGTVAGGAAC